MRGLIAGSSHVRRLQQFILNRPSLDNFALIDGPEIHFYGIRGGQISRSNDLSNISSKIQEIQPKHLILHIGENDLDNNNISKEDANELSLKLVLFANTVGSRFSLYSVTICHLLPRERTRNIKCDIYKELIKEANKALKCEIKNNSGLRYWQIFGVKNSASSVFLMECTRSCVLCVLSSRI